MQDTLPVHEFVDVESDMHCMQQVSEWKYLGDILSSNSKQDENIKERISRASEAAKEVKQMLDDLCLGEFFFQGANILRSSLFLSSLISNSESWVNLSAKNVSDLESLDEKLLRDILSAHAKTPKELLYLETGNIPVSYIIKSRRLNFLHWILNEPESSLVRRFLDAQLSSPIRNDWVTQVKEDIIKLDINLTFDEIGEFSKEAFKDLVKTKIRKEAFNDLLNLQKSHSKGKEILFKQFSLQDYLMSRSSLTKKEKHFVFKARSRTLDLRCNFKLGQSTLQCRLCDSHPEDQESLLTCPALVTGEDLPASQQPPYMDIFSDNFVKISVIAKLLQEKFTAFTTRVNRPNPCSASDKVNVIDNDINVSDDLE